MVDFSRTIAFLPQFLAGAGVTLAVSALGFALGIVIGFGLLACRRSRWRAVRFIGALYTSFIRGTPLIVQIFVVYYVLPGLVGIDLPPLLAGVLALSFNSAAFVAEILRAGLTRIPVGQYEAAKALGLKPAVTWLKIILPQLFRIIIPPMVNEFTMLVKASSILSVITVVELTRTAQNIMNVTYRPVEAFMVAAALYFVVLFAFSLLVGRLERQAERARA
ncbi:amino acid ABC transporter permease [Mesorhizobium sp. B4-1-3]|uniref:amino acid ABC transporter permease n=1 Tax=Mesorhizobium sp. B4-1-3 TaxID=2589889 RepID=UPI00112A084D|nr:amino acid ABC transporter permease [Mesorhizobium sp. B4-1-3]TPI13419.1 amino acid ABC transporter permease [Mesorhizobium sp. B4-1-3]